MVKSRVAVHCKYRESINKMDIVSLLLSHEEYSDKKEFILSLLHNKIKTEKDDIEFILKEFIQNTSDYYSHKLSFYNISTQQTLSYIGDPFFLPKWYDESGNTNKYYIDNVIDDNLKRDLSFLEQNTYSNTGYKFEFLDLESISKSLLIDNKEENLKKRSKLFLCAKIIFFILILIAIILMVLFFII